MLRCFLFSQYNAKIIKENINLKFNSLLVEGIHSGIYLVNLFFIKIS